MMPKNILPVYQTIKVLVVTISVRFWYTFCSKMYSNL